MAATVATADMEVVTVVGMESLTVDTARMGGLDTVARTSGSISQGSLD